MVVLFSPIPGENDETFDLRIFFQNGLGKQPPTR